MSVAVRPSVCRLTCVGLDISKDTYPICAFDEPNSTGVILDAFQTSLLTRALAWVKRDSDASTLIRHIDEATLYIHDPARYHDAARDIPFLHSSLYTLCHTSRHPGSYAATRQAIFPNWSACSVIAKSTPTVSQDHFCVMPAVHGFRCTSTALIKLLQTASRTDEVTFAIVHSSLLRDVLALVEHWITRQHDLVARKIMIVLCALRCGMHSSRHTLPTRTQRHVQLWETTLAAAFRKLAPHERAYFNGLVPTILESLCMLGNLAIDFSSYHVRGKHTLGTLFSVRLNLFEVVNARLGRSSSEASHWADLAIQIYRSTERYTIPERRHLFITSTCTVFTALQHSLTRQSEWYRTWPDDASSLHELLCCMVEAAEQSLENRYLECGAQVPLPWAPSWLELYDAAARAGCSPERVPLSGEPRIRAKFVHLITLMKAMAHARLLAGDCVGKDLAALATVVGPLEAPISQSCNHDKGE